MVGGVTAIQGSAKTAHPYEGWLVRNVENETFRTKKRTVFQSVRTLATADDFAGARKHLQDGQAFIYHLSEGTDPKLVREFEDLRTHDCLGPHLGAIHCTALDEPQYGEWKPNGGSVIWSPFSNLWLYRDTTDVLAARAAGLTVCLGADWSPSGSKSLLGELKVADLWSRTKLDGALSAQDICAMATCNPADALGWSDRIGRLRPGLHGDVAVVTEQDPDPYRNLVAATEADVRFVAVNGEPFYGLTSLLRSGGATHAEPIRVAGHDRAIVLVYPDVPDADMTLEAGRRRARGRPGGPAGRPPAHDRCGARRRGARAAAARQAVGRARPARGGAAGRGRKGPAAGLAGRRRGVLQGDRGLAAARRPPRRPPRLLPLGPSGGRRRWRPAGATPRPAR